jgi:hypothetical protein
MRFTCRIITRTLRTNLDSQPFIFIALDLVKTLRLRCMIDLPTVILFDKNYSLLDYNYRVIRRHVFCPIVQQPLVGQNLLYEVSRAFSDTPPSLGLLWTSDQTFQRPLRDNTQHSQETNIYAPRGIQTRNPGKRADADPSRRTRGPLGSAPRMFDQNLWHDVVITHVTLNLQRHVLTY